MERKNLHPYQNYCVEFIKDHPQAAIFLDLGLGKTAIALTAIQDLIYDSFEVNKVLVIAPLRVARDQWIAELKKWRHLNHIKMSVAVGTMQQRRVALLRKADVYVINRENVPWLIEKSGLPFDYDMVVIDELSSFKSHQAQRFKALMKVRPRVKRVVGLTGTPASNGLMDLYAEFKLIDMGERLGRFITRYRTDFFRPDRVAGAVVYSYKALPFAEEEIYRRIGDITISMKSVDYLKMPEKIVNETVAAMSESEQKTYEDMLSHMTTKIKDQFEITATTAVTLYAKLAQMANGTVYDGDGKSIDFHSRKLEALEDMIEAANGKPVLVAYWYQHDLARIEKHLAACKVNYKKMDTSAAITAWNQGEISVGLIHPASAGHGLNLQEGGSTIIWYSPVWSLELYQQTNGRLWRQGQKSQTVVIHHILTRGTIDERIMQSLQKKDVTQNTLIDAVRATISSTTKERG